MIKLLVVALVIGGLWVGTKQVVLADSQMQLLDSDGVQMLYPSAPGSRFQLSGKDPNATDRIVIEKGTHAAFGMDAAIHFWNLPSYVLNYSSGGSGWTSRLHIYASGGTQQYTWKTQHGYLVADHTDAHRSFTKDGVKLLIVD